MPLFGDIAVRIPFFTNYQGGCIMSIESARQFLAKLAEDHDFCSSLTRRLAEKRRELVAEAGYDFTEEELETAKSSLPPGALGHVAGWFCDVENETTRIRGRQCGGGLWH